MRQHSSGHGANSRYEPRERWRGGHPGAAKKEKPRRQGKGWLLGHGVFIMDSLYESQVKYFTIAIEWWPCGQSGTQPIILKPSLR
jgi:hypothetical protein